MKQGFGSGQPLLVLTVPLYFAVPGWIIIQNSFGEIPSQVLVMITQQRTVGYSPVQDFFQDNFIDMHKVTLNIQFKDIAVFLVVVAACDNGIVQFIDAVMGALTGTAAETFIDKQFFKNRIDHTEKQMMNYPVTEVRCKHLTFQRVINDKSNTGFNAVVAFNNAPVQFNQPGFMVNFKL